MVIERRTALAGAGAAAFASRLSVQGWAWPARAARFVIPAASVGPVEIPGRFPAEHLGQRLGHPVVVETRPGAGVALGTRQVIASRDGRTFLMVAGAVAFHPAVRPSSPFRDLASLPAAACANPGRLTYGSS